MASNMIERLGADWFNQRCGGAFFLFEGKLLLLRGVANDAVKAETTEAITKIPMDYFSGFKVFEYPALGYRKYGKGWCVFMTKKHTFHRGLREGCVNIQLSPVSQLVYNKLYRKLGETDMPPEGWRKMHAVFFPEYDTAADMEDLFAGKRPCVVMNADIMVEYDVSNPAAKGFVIYHRERPIGWISPEREYKWRTEEYKSAFSYLFTGK